MLEVPNARIRVKDVDPFECEYVLMLDKDAKNSLLSENNRTKQGKMVC